MRITLFTIIGRTFDICNLFRLWSICVHIQYNSDYPASVYPATRIIRHKISVPWIFLSLAIHAARFIRPRFIRFTRFIRHKISVPWSKNHCHLHGLSGFYFSTQFEVDYIFTDVILYWWIYCFKGYYFSVSTHFPLIVDFMQWLEVSLFM